LDIINKYSESIFFPLIIDTVRSCGVDNKNLERMFDFIMDQTVKNKYQTIIITECTYNDIDKKYPLIDFQNKNSLLESVSSNSIKLEIDKIYSEYKI
jgi:hypothetical protein